MLFLYPAVRDLPIPKMYFRKIIITKLWLVGSSLQQGSAWLTLHAPFPVLLGLGLKDKDRRGAGVSPLQHSIALTHRISHQ